MKCGVGVSGVLVEYGGLYEEFSDNIRVAVRGWTSILHVATPLLTYLCLETINTCSINIVNYLGF